jgi:hypothetical protein
LVRLEITAAMAKKYWRMKFYYNLVRDVREKMILYQFELGPVIV